MIFLLCHYKADPLYLSLRSSQVKDSKCRYKVLIKGGEWTHPLLPPFKVPLPIRGRGYLNVLYADEGVRVLENYQDTEGGVKWENERGVAVQIRYEGRSKGRLERSDSSSIKLRNYVLLLLPHTA